MAVCESTKENQVLHELMVIIVKTLEPQELGVIILESWKKDKISRDRDPETLKIVELDQIPIMEMIEYLQFVEKLDLDMKFSPLQMGKALKCLNSEQIGNVVKTMNTEQTKKIWTSLNIKQREKILKNLNANQIENIISMAMDQWTPTLLIRDLIINLKRFDQILELLNLGDNSNMTPTPEPMPIKIAIKFIDGMKDQVNQSYISPHLQKIKKLTNNLEQVIKEKKPIVQ